MGGKEEKEKEKGYRVMSGPSTILSVREIRLSNALSVQMLYDDVCSSAMEA
jgi:hypothetical protein